MTDPLILIAAVASFGALFVVVYLVLVIRKQASPVTSESDPTDLSELKTTVGILNSNLTKLISDVGKIDKSTDGVSTSIKEIQKFADLFSGSSQKRGHVGEVIIRQYLETLPMELWDEQFTIPGGSGRVDFVIRVNSDSKQVLLPIDSKFSMPDGEETKEDFEDSANRRALKRVDEVIQYLVPGVTTDFVLMILPNAVYYSLTSDTTRKMSEQRVIPAPVEGVIIVCSLTLRTHQAMVLQESASRLRDYALVVRDSLSTVIEGVKPLERNLKNAHKYAKETHDRLEDAVGELDRITRRIDNRGEEEPSLVQAPEVQEWRGSSQTEN